MKFWEPIQGKLTKLDEESVTIDNTSYPLTDTVREVIKRLELGDVVNIVRNKEGRVMSIGKVTFDAKTIMEEANRAAQPPQKLILSSKDKVIIRQNCLAHADAWLKVRYEDFKSDLGNVDERLEDEYFRFAEECEKWITR